MFSKNLCFEKFKNFKQSKHFKFLNIRNYNERKHVILSNERINIEQNN